MYGAEKLINLLLNQGFLSTSQLLLCQNAAKEQNIAFIDALRNLNFISPIDLQKILANFSEHPFIDLSEVVINLDLLKVLPADFCENHQLLPFLLKEKVLHLAMVDPENVVLLDQIYKKISLHSTIAKICPYYSDSKQILQKLQHNIVQNNQVLPTEIINLIDNIILQAIRNNASDIHFNPEERLLNVRYRIDGILLIARILPKDSFAGICIRLKLLCKLDIAETRNPQSGSFNGFFDQRHIDFRVSFHPTIGGENVAIRILDRDSAMLTLPQLGFNNLALAFLKDIANSPNGLVVVCGPTGAGKTTTLYALLQEVDRVKFNVMSLEQPVEYKIHGVCQTDLKEGASLDFAGGIRSILRQDPDVILVGEIRDEETAQMVMRAAMTGHLVFSTIHANDPKGAINRLLDLKVPENILTHHLLCIISQRLVRKLCLLCHGLGCEKCHNGYKDRIAIAEIYAADEKLKTYEISGDLWAQGESLIRKKITTKEEITRCLGIS